MRKTLLTLVAALLLSSPVTAQDTGALLNELTQWRGQYPAHMEPAQVGELLNNFAYAHPGWGLLRKGSGNSCPLRDTFISCDILIYQPTIVHYDVLTDAENSARPQFNVVGPCVLGPSSGCDMKNFLPPYQPVGSQPQPTPSPTPAPVPTDFAGFVTQFINAAAGSMDAGHAKLDAIGDRQVALAAKVDQLLAAIASIQPQSSQALSEDTLAQALKAVQQLATIQGQTSDSQARIKALQSQVIALQATVKKLVPAAVPAKK